MTPRTHLSPGPRRAVACAKGLDPLIHRPDHCRSRGSASQGEASRTRTPRLEAGLANRLRDAAQGSRRRGPPTCSIALHVVNPSWRSSHRARDGDHLIALDRRQWMTTGPGVVASLRPGRIHAQSAPSLEHVVQVTGEGETGPWRKLAVDRGLRSIGVPPPASAIRLRSTALCGEGVHGDGVLRSCSTPAFTGVP